MSNEYRASWKEQSIREAEVDHFRKLKAVEDLLFKIVNQAGAVCAEQEAAVKAGVDPLVSLVGSRACGLDVDGNSLPEKPTKPPAKPRKPRVYQPRVYTPQMVALGARAALILLDLTPRMLDLWTRLVRAGIDPRRLALEHDEAKIAALLFDEIGVQYHDLDAGDYDRLKKALDRIEAWLDKMKQAEAEKPQANGPPGPAAEPDATLTPQAEQPPEQPVKAAREPAPYSAGKDSLDWTKL